MITFYLRQLQKKIESNLIELFDHITQNIRSVSIGSFNHIIFFILDIRVKEIIGTRFRINCIQNQEVGGGCS